MAAEVEQSCRRRKNSCTWWAAVTQMPGPRNGVVRARFPPSARLNSSLIRLLDELTAFLNHRIAGSPGHDGYRGGRILGRTFDQPVRINHVDQNVPLCVAAAHDLHLLEEERAPLPEHVVALFHLVLETNRS